MVTLSKSQEVVVSEFPGFLMNDEPEAAIAGFAGSGKTFLVQYLSEIVEKQITLIGSLDGDIPKRNVFFAATTNKAALVLKDVVGQPVRTIHKLLGLVVQNNFKTGKQKLVAKGRAANINNSVVFIDESSMINEELLHVIRTRARKARDCKLVFIGDSYQLPPVKENECPVFSTCDKIWYLNEIQRQVVDSPIIRLSAQYREMLDDHTLDWPDIPHNGDTIVYHDKKETFFHEMAHAFVAPHEPTDVKILAWSNKRVNQYNSWVRGLCGHKGPFVPGEVIVTNRPLFVHGVIEAPTDSVHTIRTISPAKQHGTEGYWIQLEDIQGKFFQPKDFDEAIKLLKKHAIAAKKNNDWKPYFDVKEKWADLRPVHASTVHKAQGSTYRTVFVDLSNIGTNTKWKEVARLVYVAITRASESVHIFGELTMSYNKTPPPDLSGAFDGRYV